MQPQGLHGGDAAQIAAKAAGPLGGCKGPLPPQKHAMCVAFHQQLATPHQVPVDVVNEQEDEITTTKTSFVFLVLTWEFG